MTNRQFSAAVSHAPPRGTSRGDGVELTRVSATLGSLLTDHVVSMEALREVGELASAVDRRSPAGPGEDRMPVLEDDERRAVLNEALAGFGGLLTALADREQASSTGAGSGAAALQDLQTENVELTFDTDEKGVSRGSVNVTDPAVSDYLSEYLIDAAFVVKAPARSELLMSSLLTTLVGSFDALSREIATIYFETYPGALGTEPEFSLADLANSRQSMRPARN